MKMKYMDEDQLGCLFGRRELGQGHKVGHFTEVVHKVRMTVWPSEGGRPVTKSSDMWDQGRCGTESHHRSPIGAWQEVMCGLMWEERTGSLVGRTLD